MPLQLANKLTLDAYDPALTLGPDGNVRQLRFLGYNNAYAVELALYDSDDTQSRAVWVPDEYVYAPNTGDVFGPEVAGVRFRSYNPGNPAAIFATLAYRSDPPASPVPPFPPSAAPIPGSAYQPIGENQHVIAAAHTPTHLHSGLPCASIVVSALSTNVGKCYVGDANMVFSNGYILEPGDKVAFACGNASQVYVDGDNIGDVLSWMTVG